MKMLLLAAACSCVAAIGQTAPPPAADLADSMARRLSDSLHVKTVVGKPVVAGSVTLIPILTVDVSFGGLDVTLPAPAPSKPDGKPAPAAAPKAEPPAAFLVTGEARPLGFVAITKKGTKFVPVPKEPAGGRK